MGVRVLYFGRLRDAAGVSERFAFTMSPDGLRVALRRRNGAAATP